MPRALLFDLDGTLLHSDPIHETVFEELWAARGLEAPEGFYMTHIHGRLNVDVFAEFLPDEPDPQGLSEWKEAQFRDRLPRPYPATPGAAALIGRAETEGWRMAVVTNAMRLNAEAMLQAIGLRGAFETIVIGEECSRAKPHPDPYLAAMRDLGVAPSDCVAFEDSPSGLRSAAASGAFTIGVRSGLDDAALRAAGARATIQDFNDPALPDLLERAEGVTA
ncbi:haloacid dehalogenase superfamily, subfamily IA, variant 3 with third motif having DD or ED [Cribrihabitans marinus]|uniref:Haloacid dehalogenase superfamily, subfamily IA, variant 3 with third motif having DD or ED n=1 Tax=Cribrihabitans marinus TaxID=1227549 RepID=A0A1H6WPK6_9RHOB|nr:HAD family phosphatase [Cribrihabitans marinus]GGH24025.1 haloacid dehalogenase [Cribrihabitans marinus]SEJ16127.1 haloacid dehalogenase superfamily, subfamily IA, variant 3 with third motif having DD or ED [Cribrihabitans marinus]